MLPSIWTKYMEIILPLDEKSNKEEKERKKNTRVRYSTLTTFITTVTLNGTTIGDKLVETLYSNRVTSHKKETTPLHSKLGCLLFSTGSSNSGTTLHGGNGVGKLYYTLLKSVKRNKASFGRSGSTNFAATLHGGMREEKLYYTLLKSVKRQKAPFGWSISTNFVSFLLTLLLELIDTLDNQVYASTYTSGWQQCFVHTIHTCISSLNVPKGFIYFS